MAEGEQLWGNVSKKYNNWAGGTNGELMSQTPASIPENLENYEESETVDSGCLENKKGEAHPASPLTCLHLS